MTVSKWKSESPVSKTLLCWKQLGWFVKIRLMHVGVSGFLKHVGFLIKLVSPLKLQNFAKHFSLTEALKSPKNRKFWYTLLYSSMMRLRHSRWFDIKLLLGLYEPLMNHFLFLKFTSTQIDSILQLDFASRNLRVYPHEHKVLVLHRLGFCQAYKKYHSSLT